MLRCRVCGRPGFDICPDCQFKEMNQQCWRCRMYIPLAEMQQWRGQWICPNCRMELREEEERSHTKETGERLGQCERCGRRAGILYRWKGRLLCEICLDKDEDYAGGRPSAGGIRIRPLQKKRHKGLLRRIFEFIFGRNEKEETEIVEVAPRKKAGKKGAPPEKKTDWSRFKSFTEEAAEE